MLLALQMELFVVLSQDSCLLPVWVMPEEGTSFVFINRFLYLVSCTFFLTMSVRERVQEVLVIVGYSSINAKQLKQPKFKTTQLTI